MRVLKIFAGVVGALVAGLAITSVAARFNDGTLGMIPGGPPSDSEVWFFEITSMSPRSESSA